MIAIFTFLVGGCVFWHLGRRYQDFQDLMLARRVSKLVVQREQLAKEQSDYERFERQDARLRKVNEKLEEEIG